MPRAGLPAPAAHGTQALQQWFDRLLVADRRPPLARRLAGSPDHRRDEHQRQSWTRCSTAQVTHQAPPGSVKGRHLVVHDIEQARAQLVGRGVQVGPVQDVGGGVKYAGLVDPGGDTLTLQEMSWRTGERF